MNEEIKKSLDYWDNLHKEYNKDEIVYDDWLERFSNIIDNCNTPILDLGCGSGNNTLYLINKNKKVIACDQSKNAINNIKKNFKEIYDTKCFNMLDGFPFEDNNFEVVIADLCLHYFRKKDTLKIIKELKRIIKNNGYLLVRVNSINDINHGAGQGTKVENNLYKTSDGRLKRFFDEKDIKELFKELDLEYLNEDIMTRYKLEKKLFVLCLKNIK